MPGKKRVLLFLHMKLNIKASIHISLTLHFPYFLSMIMDSLHPSLRVLFLKWGFSSLFICLGGAFFPYLICWCFSSFIISEANSLAFILSIYLIIELIPISVCWLSITLRVLFSFYATMTNRVLMQQWHRLMCLLVSCFLAVSDP